MRYPTLPLAASLLTVLIVPLVLSTTPARAQSTTEADTLRTYELESIVVTADRSARLLSSSTSAVSLLQAEELKRMPLNTFADALEMMPGFAFLSLDGLGFESQATIRGFYGGGEAEYVVMLIDGRPINGLERGLINWNLMSLDNIKSVEAVRGGVSSLYGDAAIGGVVNVITTAGAAVPSTRLVLRGGAYETLNGHASHNGLLGTRRYAVHGGLERTNGFRDHAERQFGNVGASIDLVRANDRG
jgi:outer membrane cobalamin receptor